MNFKKENYVFVARVFLSLVFIVAGFNKLTGFSGFAGSLSLPFPTLFAVLAVLFELGGGLILLLGYRTKLAANVLIVFVIATLVLVHNVATDFSQLSMFLKNLALIGGLMLLHQTGPGSFSLTKK